MKTLLVSCIAIVGGLIAFSTYADDTHIASVPNICNIEYHDSGDPVREALYQKCIDDQFIAYEQYEKNKAGKMPQSNVPNYERTFGIGVAGGYGTSYVGIGTTPWTTEQVSAIVYPSLELQIFDQHNTALHGHIEVSLPIGNIIYQATQGYAVVGGSAYYVPDIGKGFVRPFLSPGLGLAYAAGGGAEIVELGFDLRAGIEVLTPEQRAGFRLFAQGTGMIGMASPTSNQNNNTWPALGASISLLAEVSFYGTRTIVTHK